MRVECERCHALVVADFDVDPDGVTVACGACGGTFRAEARPRKPTAATLDLDAGPGCVKCGAAMTDEPACPRCGLTRERARAWAAADDAPSAEVVAAWAKAEASWSDPAAHDRVAGLALGHGALPWLARRYREVQRTRPADGVARARIDRIGLMSLAALQATATVPASPRGRTRVAYLVIIIVALVLAGVLLAAKATSTRHTGKRRPAIPVERGGRDRGQPGPPSIEPPGPGR